MYLLYMLNVLIHVPVLQTGMTICKLSEVAWYCLLLRHIDTDDTDEMILCDTWCDTGDSLSENLTNFSGI